MRIRFVSITAFLRFLSCLVLVIGGLSVCFDASASSKIHDIAPGGPAHAFLVPPLKGTLNVRPFEVQPSLADKTITVRLSENAEFRHFHDHAWEDVPARLLASRLAHFLKTAKAADIIAKGAENKADYTLKGALKSVDLSVNDQGEQILSVSLAMQITDKYGMAVLNDTYVETAPLSSFSAGGTVAAVNQSMAHIFTDFLMDIRGQIS